ncbi:MAG: hypothetical protein ACI8X5_001049 [Planctomycetota bacterium]|jgi:hypothetical protein
MLEIGACNRNLRATERTRMGGYEKSANGKSCEYHPAERSLPPIERDPKQTKALKQTKAKR